MFLQLGDRRFDLAHRPVVVGILNRTRNAISRHRQAADLGHALRAARA